MLSKDFWQKYFRDYDLLNELIPYQELLDAFVAAVKPKQGQRVLDAGSGTGNLAALIECRGAKVVGLDFSPAGMALHKEKIPNAELHLADLRQPLSFPDNSFDAIVSNNTLYAIPRSERPAIFRELRRVLKPGGMVAVANVIEGFNPMSVYLAHLKAAIQKDGLFSTLSKAIRLISPTVRIFYWNKLIMREHSGGRYDFFKTGEQVAELTEARFRQVSPDRQMYAGQSIFNTGIK